MDFTTFFLQKSCKVHQDNHFLLSDYYTYYNKNVNLKKYSNQIIKNDYPDGLYNFFAGKKFKENLGEYYQGTDSTKIKKRVITYTIFKDN